MQHTYVHDTRHLPSAHLAQTMALLSLTTLELRQEIDSQLASNPALELVDERRCPTCHRLLPARGACPICSRPQTLTGEPIVFTSPREDFYTGSGATTADDSQDDDYSPASEDLPTYVLRQIAPELSHADRPLAAWILTHLDEDGFLAGTTPLEVARYHHIPLERVNNVMRLIQRADPVGVGSAGPQEALLVQLDVLAETRPVPELARAAIEQGLSLLSRHQYGELARLIHTSHAKAQALARFIGENLNPFPARCHWGEQRRPMETTVQVYHQPDIIISFQNEDPAKSLVVEIILPLSGTLRINPLFRQAIRTASSEKIEEWKADLESASLLVKCLQQRNNTMQRLMQRVASIQADFIRHGEQQLRPLTRASLAHELDVHESTISRAVSGKAVQLPSGRIVPLSKFFDRSLNVRSVLKSIIQEETNPLSDSELVGMLNELGFSVARRTVAKYRAMEGILPAHLRHPVHTQVV